MTIENMSKGLYRAKEGQLVAYGKSFIGAIEALLAFIPRTK